MEKEQLNLKPRWHILYICQINNREIDCGNDQFSHLSVGNYYFNVVEWIT